jgi:hypothetical protein
VLRPGVPDSDVLDALFVQKPPELEVDLACGKVVRIEARGLALDLRDLRNLRVRLGEPARVVRDAALARYRAHTITSPS